MHKGPKNPMWKGGRSLASSGYVLIRVGVEHHLADSRGYAYEHRVVAEKKIGRRLREGEIVHHVNGNKTDNTPENLEICKSRFHHHVEHRRPGVNNRLPEERNPLIKCSCGCGKELRKYDSQGRPRSYINSHNAQRGEDGRWY